MKFQDAVIAWTPGGDIEVSHMAEVGSPRFDRHAMVTGFYRPDLMEVDGEDAKVAATGRQQSRSCHRRSTIHDRFIGRGRADTEGTGLIGGEAMRFTGVAGGIIAGDFDGSAASIRPPNEAELLWCQWQEAMAAELASPIETPKDAYAKLWWACYWIGLGADEDLSPLAPADAGNAQ
jgi:hypothetical protein